MPKAKRDKWHYTKEKEIKYISKERGRRGRKEEREGREGGRGKEFRWEGKESNQYQN